MEPVLLHLFFI